MENKISDIVRASLESAKNIVDGNTVIGEAIPTAAGTVIIPVSKVSVGIASGGVDYKSKLAKDVSRPENFGGGGGTGISVTPVAFLVVKADGTVELLNVDFPTETATGDTLDTIVSFIRKSPELINKIKEFFKKEDTVEDTFTGEDVSDGDIAE